MPKTQMKTVPLGTTGLEITRVEQLRRIQQIAPVETLQPPYSLEIEGAR